MKNIVYAKNPLLAMFPKNESPDGFAGKYIPREMGMLNRANTVNPEMGIPWKINKIKIVVLRNA